MPRIIDENTDIETVLEDIRSKKNFGKMVKLPHLAYGLNAEQAAACNQIARILARLPCPDSEESARFVARMYSGNVDMFKYMMNNPHLIKCPDPWYNHLIAAKNLVCFHDELEYHKWVNEVRERMGWRAGERQHGVL